MPTIVPISLTGDPYIGGVLAGYKWATQILSYSFPSSAALYGAPYGSGETSNNFGVLSTQQQTAVRTVLANYAAVANLTFNELTETSSQHADLRFALTDATSTAHAYLPTTAAVGGDVWLRNSGGSYSSPARGNYAFATFLHETGHALGMDHAHDGRAAVPTDHDSLEYTVMSYRSYQGASTTSGYINENWGFPQSLMMLDIAAVQQLYGANFNTNSGATTYSWSPTTGEMFVNGVGQGAPGGNNIFLTVWDGGGNDTYDLSNYSTNLAVNLEPGAWSTTSRPQLALLSYDGSHVAAGNIANALVYQGNLNSLIENAIGGSGNDTIYGNQVANILHGGAGNDTLSGGAGDDQLYGDAGADTLIGGTGSDLFIFNGPGFGADSILDFLAGQDHIVLSRSGFGLAAQGSLASAGVNFVTGANATSAGPTLIYETAGSNVYWDADGTGANARTLLAHVAVSGGDISLGSLNGWNHAASGDFNGDGTDDILWQNSSSGANYLWLMDNGQVVQSGPLGTVPGWEVLASADLNGDSTSDLIWHNQVRGENFVWLMQAGQPSESFYGGLIPGWQLASHADITGDHVDDLLWRNASTGENFVWAMKDGQPSSSYSLGTIPGWKLLTSGDFNGDGTSDLVWNNPASQTNFIWLMQNGQPYESFYAGNIPGWSAAAVGDFNRDGTDDILWQNGASKQAYMWLMSNGQPSQTFDIPQLSNAIILGSGDYNGDGGTDILSRDAASGAIHVTDITALLSPTLHASDWIVA